MALEKPHYYRRGYVIRKVRNDLNRSAAVLLLCECRYINLQNIFVYDCHIVIRCKRLLENRYEVGINLNRCNLPRILTQKLCHGSDSGTNLKYKVILCDTCLADNLLDNISVY